VLLLRARENCCCSQQQHSWQQWPALLHRAAKRAAMVATLLLPAAVLLLGTVTGALQPTASADWVATMNHSTAGAALLAGFDVDDACLSAKTPLVSCPLAVFWRLGAPGSAATCWRVNTNGTLSEIVPGEFVNLPPLPWRVEVMRRGSYFFLTVNGERMAFVRSPRMEIHCNGNNGGARPAHVEPIASGAAFQSANATLPSEIKPVSWGTVLDEPVVTHGHQQWSASQAIPGAVLRENGTTFLYFVSAAQNMPAQEAGGNCYGGLAHCPSGKEADPSAWTYLPDPILKNQTGPGRFDNVSVFVNGIVKAPDGRYAISFFGEPIMSIGFAFADTPFGPFEQDNSYYLNASMFPEWAGQAQHEHDLIRLDNGTYLLFYTGFGGFRKTATISHPSIDQGGIATSEDLKTWTFVQRPVLKHRYDESSGCDPLRDNCKPNVAQYWDGAFVRPRSLNKIGDWWYCLYEGANGYPRQGTEPGSDTEHLTGCDGITDSIGLARSRDLLEWEMDFPLQLAVPQQPGDRFDSIWVGWPRAIQHNATHMYVFYAAGGLDFWTKGTDHIADTGLMTVPIEKFVDFGEMN
jgi:hypothetical protein